MITFTDDELAVLTQALAYYESHVAGVVTSAKAFGWYATAELREKDAHTAERLRDRIREAMLK